MKTEKEILNHIRWDPKLHKEDWRIHYLDLGKLKEIKYADIKKTDEGLMLIDIDGKETAIPLHRIRKITRNGETVWQR